jgi:hypothetical protein
MPEFILKASSRFSIHRFLRPSRGFWIPERVENPVIQLICKQPSVIVNGPLNS